MINTKEISIRKLSGVGPKTAQALENVGICSFYDLLYRFPRIYENHTPRYSLDGITAEQKNAFILRIKSAPKISYTQSKRRIVRFSARLSEESPLINIVFFNQPYLISTFHVGEDWLFFGRISKSSGGYYMFSPSFEKPADTFSECVPIYSNHGTVTGKKIAKLIGTCLDSLISEELAETLPCDILENEGFYDIKSAFFAIHRPISLGEAKKASERFAFEELFNFALASLKLIKRENMQIVDSFEKTDLTVFCNSLPFTLTEAQKRAINEIENDLTGGGAKRCRAMKRLVQGDVGSGKTVVAAAAMYMTAKNHAKSVIMAPTEILARQHFESLSKIMAKHEIPVLLLTGSTTAVERKVLEKKLLSDMPLILVGTHALFESGINAKNIRLVITDEQHRFGVAQREKLLSMAEAPNSLVMSATPIPRTLAMFLYAGLDISVIDEVPKGRMSIETFLIPPSKKDRLYSFIGKQLSLGYQGYVICPLVEDDDELFPDLLSAQQVYETLSKKLSDYRVGLIHGKMKSDEKREIMEAFAGHDIDLLVATTVIEVGIDVPNATVIAIENAERFGLAQLHQLRGRVGRGNAQSHCILITPSKSRDALERLSFMCRSKDGFEIAEYDLEKRGPGDFFGNRQHGDMPFSFAKSAGNITLLKSAMQLAEKYKDKI